MKRRDFIKAVGGAGVAWPLGAHAQSPQAIRRVGIFLGSAADDDAEAKLHIETLQDSLRKLGWTAGRNIRFEPRFSRGDAATMTAHVAELVSMAPDVIVVQGNRPTAMLKQATRTVPIVFALVGDPVGGGYIDNLARPGGNVTGFTHFEPAMGGKWIESLKDVVPALKRVAIVMHPDTPANIAFMRVAEAAAPALGVTLIQAGVRDAASVEREIAAAAGPDTGIAVMPHDVTVAHRSLIVAMAARHKLPAVYPYRYYVTDGGLVSYSLNTVDHWQRVAGYVDRILRGEKPAALPVQAPTKFELVVNLKTAKTLGLTVPPTLLTRADEVIE